MKKNEILKATPNTLATFEYLMLLGHTLHEKTGNDYSVTIDMKNDCVRLFVEVK